MSSLRFLGISLLPIAACFLQAQEPIDTAALDAALNDDYAARLESFSMQASGPGYFQEKELLVYDCKYIQAATLRRVLEEFITSEGMVAESSESDQLVVSDIGSNIKILQSIIEKLDQPVPQVLIEARIVELNIDSDL